MVCGAQKCLYKRIRPYFSKRKIFDEGYEIAILEMSKSVIQKYRKAFLNEIKKIPLNDIYQKMELYIKKGENIPDEVSSFRLISTKMKDGKNKYSFRWRDYDGHAGGYVIKENGIAVYVGKSDKWLFQAMINHFSPYALDREGSHYRVEFSETLYSCQYEVALIHVPSLGKTQQ